MSEPSDTAVHEFALLLAGWVPDEKLAALRRALADGQAAAAAATAVALAAEYNVPMLAASIEAARSLTGDPGALDGVETVDQYPRPPFRFSETNPDQSLEANDQDREMAEAAQARVAQIAGLWRTWRLPSEGDEAAARRAAVDPADPDRPHLVYVVQVPDAAAAPVLAGELHAVVDEHGGAGVEVIALDAALQPYQAAALEGSALLWAAQDGEPPFRIARVFDFAKPETGPGFSPGHRMVTDSGERERLLEFLTSGTLVLHTTARTYDVLDPQAGQVVPSSFRTDGEWIWTDSVAYYLEQHGLAPDEDLAAHIEARWQAGDTDAGTDQETAIAAANFLLYPPEEFAREPVWTPGPAAERPGH
jgi:hypothetical protein